MKPFTLIAIVCLLIAGAGICYDYSPNEHATWISYVSCLPLLGWVVLLLVKAFGGSLNDRAGR